MADVDSIVNQMRENPKGVKYSHLCKVCNHYFGDPRQQGTSHRIYKMPWIGDPRVNIQKAKGNMTKEYQVKQVLKAIAKIELLKK
jgi:hypothetical protein